jgi:hypothetical protein
MGSHYNSIHVREAEQGAVTAAVKTLLTSNKSGRGLIGPPLNGWVGVYTNDAVGGDGFSSTLSERLNTTVLALVLHDSSLILYQHFHAGKLVDEYSSDPDYFEKVSPADHERLKGRPGLFGSLVDSFAKVQAIAFLLAPEQKNKFVFEDDRFREFARLLGLQNALTSYDYLTEGEPHGITRRKEFIHVPDLTAEKVAAKAARAAVRAELKRLKTAGVLVFDLKPKFMGGIETAFDPVDGGLLLNLDTVSHQPGQKVVQVKPPWTAEAEPLDLGLDTAPSSLTFSRTGKWLAGHDGQLRVWDWRERKLLNLGAPGLWPVQFSPDENLLLCLSQKGFSVLSLQTGETLQSAQVAARHILAWHPECRFVVTRPRQDQLGLVDLQQGKLTKVLYSGRVQDWSRLPSFFSETFKEAGFSERRMAAIAKFWIVGSDGPFNVRFSSDGRLLFCATTGGLRVLQWEKVLGADKATPPPLYATSPLQLGSPPLEEKQYTDFVYDLAVDEPANRLLFCDIQGIVWFLNLKDRRSGALLKPPEKNSACRLLLSPDRQHFCCHCTPPAGARGDPKGRIQVWNYQKLLEAAGLNSV